ncbi:MAG: low molecular weight protein-tyrosine-phosphatase [Planctomycetota bacterium]|jgi:protein-tyrosine phosphatase
MNGASDPCRIIFICTGNICRSPAAENIFREYAARAGILDDLEIDSAGTGDWHEGQPPDHRSASALRTAGYADDGVARGLRAHDFSRHDLFVCMDRSHLREVVARGAASDRVVLLRQFDESRGHDDVPDPYYGGEDGFTEMIGMIEATMDGLVARVRTELAKRGGARGT